MSVGRGVFMNARSVGLHSLKRVNYRLQFFEFYLEQGQRLLGRIDRFCGDSDDLLTDEAHAITRKHRTIEQKASKMDIRQVSSGQDRFDPGNLFRRRDVNRDDARMRKRA